MVTVYKHIFVTELFSFEIKKMTFFFIDVNADELLILLNI